MRPDEMAEELNGGVPRGDAWHRQLLHDMALDLPGLRPPLLTPSLATDLAEYLRLNCFRS